MAWTHHILLPGLPASSTRGALGWCNVVLLQDGDRRLLFDTGSHGDRAPLLAALAGLGLDPEDIDTVFLSHFHYDHVLNAEIFPRARVFLSEAEQAYVAENGFRRAMDPYVPELLLTHLRPRLELVRDGQEVLPGLVALALPGHTPGVMGLLSRESGVLLAGDGVKNAWEFSRDQAPPCFGQPEQALESYARVRALGGLVIPGHDRPFRLGAGGALERPPIQPLEVCLYLDPGERPRVWTMP